MNLKKVRDNAPVDFFFGFVLGALLFSSWILNDLFDAAKELDKYCIPVDEVSYSIKESSYGYGERTDN